MTILSNPDNRRGLRAAIQAISALIGLAFIGWIIYTSHDRPSTLYMIAGALLAIAALRETFYGAENVTRAVKFHAGKDGIEAEIGKDEAVDAVVDAAADAAQAVKST